MGGGGSKDTQGGVKRAEGDAWEEEEVQGAAAPLPPTTADAEEDTRPTPEPSPDTAALPDAPPPPPGNSKAASEERTEERTRNPPDRRPTLPGAKKVGVIGLDGAGKSRLGDAFEKGAGWCFQSLGRAWERRAVVHEGVQLDLWVASGVSEHRARWREVCAGAEVVVAVLDLSDPLRLPLAWSELLAFVTAATPPRLLILCTTLFPTQGNAATTLPLLSSSFHSLPSTLKWTAKDINYAGTNEEVSVAVNAAFAWVGTP